MITAVSSQLIIPPSIDYGDLVKAIYRYAKEKNEAALRELEGHGYCLGVYHQQYNAVMLLAKEGDHDSVTFLLNKFNASRQQIAEGYARGGHEAMVDKLIAEGVDKSIVLRGYAYARNTDKINEILAAGHNIDSAIFGLAMGGHKDLVDNYINVNSAKYSRINHAIEGFAEGGHIQEMNDYLDRNKTDFHSYDYDWALMGLGRANNTELIKHFIQLGGDQSIAASGLARGGFIREAAEYLPLEKGAIVACFASGGHISQVNQLIDDETIWRKALHGYLESGYLEHSENIYRTLSATENIAFRKLLAEHAQLPKVNENKAETLLKKANHIAALKKAFHLDYAQAQVFNRDDIRTWLLQGQQLIPQTLIYDIFFAISAHVTDLSVSDTVKLLAALNKQYFLDISHYNSSAHKQGLFSTSRYQQEQNQTTARYEQRQNFIRY